MEVGLAIKETESLFGGFLESKYTSPKILNSNWALESRTRAQAENAYKNDDINYSLTQRIAAKGSWNLGRKWSIYQITGLNTKVSLEGDGVQSLTPVLLGGVGYNVNKNLNIYAEGDLSKSYNLVKKSWNEKESSIYLGLKYTF